MYICIYIYVYIYVRVCRVYMRVYIYVENAARTPSFLDMSGHAELI